MTDLKNNLEEVWREDFESLFNEKYNQVLYGHTLKHWTAQDLINQEFKFGLNYYIEARKKAQEEISDAKKLSYKHYGKSEQLKIEKKQLEQELQKAQEEINSLRSAYKKNIDSLSAGLSEDLLKILKTYPTALPYICELKQELQKTREYLGKAIKSAEFFMSHADCKKDSWVCKCSFCRDTESSKNLREARQYFQDKENKDEK